MDSRLRLGVCHCHSDGHLDDEAMIYVFFLLSLFAVPAHSVEGVYWYSSSYMQDAIADSNPADVCLRSAKKVFGDDAYVVSYPDENGEGCVGTDPHNKNRNFIIRYLPFSCPGNETLLFYDDTTYGFIGCGVASNECSAAKPITSSTQAQTACYNQCGYTTLGGFRDYDNALAPVAYEYLPTGDVCSGSEDTSQLAGVSEYTEINEEELDCRSDPGIQVCISEDKTCKIVNGYPVCFDEATNQDELNCGTFNGEVVCFEKNAYSNCQYVNGEYLCTYPEGNKVDPDSVDHPINGGNANGLTHDDILDQQDLTENTPEAQSVKQIVKETGIRQQAEKQAESDNPSSSISGLGCDKEVSCTGDAIQCAIARIQKKQLCLSEFNESDINSIISGNSEMSPLGTLPGDTLEVHVDDFLETDEYVTSDNQCPDPLSYTVLGVEYEIILNPLCDLASYISYFITFATWFSMSVVLAKSMGTG
ncbi:virulence factor TspB C-terminal domain-related protein [uncultured Endozoicomonas sp.]|uniref:virulence factor TspB C-terminal domain-related protein n=1 Tax=uncultured Endozoicomonas sp. TaxID=432652 RepID=UPI00260C7353|nr:virulence factor TspB C-terminal domain-related protein [uncultured Endozoicomonas sp.]